MMQPRYRGVTKEQIPVIRVDDGIIIKLISGEFNGVRGPVGEIVIDPGYMDVSLPEKTVFVHRIKKGYTVFAYIISGLGYFDGDGDKLSGPETLVVYGDGEELEIRAEKGELRFLLISGRPLGEPVAWYGPIVMNTREELETAFEEYRLGTFLKHDKAQ